MINNPDDISTSGFVSPSDYSVSAKFSGHSEISAKGYCRLYKVQRGGQWFVLKVLKSEFAADPVYQGLFDKEYNLMMQLNHPNIVRIYGVEEDAVAGKCMVMEYVDGRTLDEFLAENPPQNVRKEVTGQLLDAIGYCHGKQMMHRDLKPSNILVTYNGNRVKLIDFGLSDSDSYAVLKDPAYTKAYAAPEQLAGENIDCRTDLYAFGLILRQLFPNRYGHVAQKCTQPQREKRYASAAEVAASMKKGDRRRKQIPWLLVVAFAIVTLAVIVIWFWPHSKNSDILEPESSTVFDTVFSDKYNSEGKSLFLPAKEHSVQSDMERPEASVHYGPVTIVTGEADTAAIADRARRTDSVLYARDQEKQHEQNALDNAIYNFKFTIDSMFEPVNQYVKSNEVKTSNILRDLIYIAEYKSKIRECLIRSQLPRSKRNSFFNYANNQIETKKKSYKQNYPAIPMYPNEREVRDSEIYQPIWEQSQRYQEEGRRLYQEWKMQKVK